MGRFHSGPIAADGFGIASFTYTRAARISSIKQSQTEPRSCAAFWATSVSNRPHLNLGSPRPISLLHRALGRSASCCRLRAGDAG